MEWFFPAIRGVRWFVLQGVGKKLNTPLVFAPHLDARPYLSSTVLRKRFSAKHTLGAAQPKSDSSNSPPEGSSVMYELYAVVCHRGNLQARTPVPANSLLAHNSEAWRFS